MSIRVSKFGGTSLASAQQFKKVADIIHSDPDRRYVVASAPGKRYSEDIKVTDLLNKSFQLAYEHKDYSETLGQIRERFSDIIEELEIHDFSIDDEIQTINEHLASSPNPDYVASRGEYINSKILARYLGYTFVDPAGVIIFNQSGLLDKDTTKKNLK